MSPTRRITCRCCAERGWSRPRRPALWPLRHVLDTHIHADHLSRARQLATISGATLRLPDQRRVRFAFEPVHEGDTIEFGGSRLTALHTPGHTDESLSYLLDGAIAFTGDTLFVRGVGRPDLHAQPAEAERRARTLFTSLKRLRALTPDTIVLPAHTTATPSPSTDR